MSAARDVRVGDRAFVVETLAADIEAETRRARPGRFTIAIPGGSVASACFPRLAKPALDWTAVDFFWVDERAVSATDSESNYRLARDLWLDPADIPAGRIHRMPGESSDLDQAAGEYANELIRATGDPPRLDYVLLGVGPDGHVASLFPGHGALEDTRHVLAIHDAPKPPARRLTLSLPVITAARRVAIVAFGEAKADVIDEALKDETSPLPVARVVRAAARCAVLADRAAASRL